MLSCFCQRSVVLLKQSFWTWSGKGLWNCFFDWYEFRDDDAVGSLQRRNLKWIRQLGSPSPRRRRKSYNLQDMSKVWVITADANDGIYYCTDGIKGGLSYCRWYQICTLRWYSAEVARCSKSHKNERMEKAKPSIYSTLPSPPSHHPSPLSPSLLPSSFAQPSPAWYSDKTFMQHSLCATHLIWDHVKVPRISGCPDLASPGMRDRPARLPHCWRKFASRRVSGGAAGKEWFIGRVGGWW